MREENLCAAFTRELRQSFVNLLVLRSTNESIADLQFLHRILAMPEDLLTIDNWLRNSTATVRDLKISRMINVSRCEKRRPGKRVERRKRFLIIRIRRGESSIRELCVMSRLLRNVATLDSYQFSRSSNTRQLLSH